jgi:hypothetical protein
MKRTPEQAERRRQWITTLTPEELSIVACIGITQAKAVIDRANANRPEIVQSGSSTLRQTGAEGGT